MGGIVDISLAVSIDGKDDEVRPWKMKLKLQGKNIHRGKIEFWGATSLNAFPPYHTAHLLIQT
jgi:hypothetical protein